MSKKFKNVTQLKIDIAYNKSSEIEALYKAICKLNENSEFDTEIMDDGNAPYTSDLTEAYKNMGAIE